MNSNIQAFFELLRAGLWSDGNLDLWIDGITDWHEVYKLASDQSVLGLVLAGLEHSEVRPPKDFLLQWIGEVQIIEQRNKDMNAFIADLIEKLRKNDIYALLVKGQGIAQCYERPLWRTCGDVDLLLSVENYEKAKALLVPLADRLEKEFVIFKHYGMTINGWEVELHGTLCPRLTKRIDRAVDDAQYDVFCQGNVRSWVNGNTMVFLPSVDNDIIFVFTHVLKHFFIEGIGLRQICDWCRLLYTYKDSLDYRLLETRIRKAGILTEWKAFAALAVDWLGMPVEMMPFYSSDKKWGYKAKRIMGFVLESGNFGHNRTKGNAHRNSKIGGKMRSFIDHTKIIVRHSIIFPFDAIKVWWNMVVSGMEILVND